MSPAAGGLAEKAPPAPGSQPVLPSKPAAEQPARQKIVAAAFSVLAERGSAEASIKEIARAAGIAPGLVHYYFASKGELLLEVVREACCSYRSQMNALELPEDPVARVGALLAWSRQRGLELPDWYRLMVDLDALALRDPHLAIEVAALKREVREHTAALVADTASKLQVSLGVSHDGLAAVLMTSVDGLVLQKLIDPSFDLEGGFDALEKLLLALLRAAAAPL